MTMDETIAAATELLAVLQLADSFFPSGRFTLSHGLESFGQAGLLPSAATLQPLVVDYLTEAVAPSEGVAVAEANRAAARGDFERLVDIDQLLFALKLPAEASASSTRTGRQLLVTAVRIGVHPILSAYDMAVKEGLAPGCHAVVFGVVTAVWGLSPLQAVVVELYTYAANLLGAALRTVRLDHVQAQEIIMRVRPAIADAAAMAARTDFKDMSAFAPTIESMQMLHQHAHVRLFAS
jgi:urease accessory protein